MFCCAGDSINWGVFQITGSVKITEGGSSRVMTLNGSSRYRAYADMNWGSDFPSPPPNVKEGSPEALDFAWGWYYAGQPATENSPEISIIGGVGLCYVDSLLGNMSGKFMDVRIGDSDSVEVRKRGRTFYQLWAGERGSFGPSCLFDPRSCYESTHIVPCFVRMLGDSSRPLAREQAWKNLCSVFRRAATPSGP